MSNTEQLQVPAYWRIAQLKDVCEKITDGTHKTPNYQDAGVRFISIKNIRPYQPVNWDSYVKFITRTEHEELIRRCKPEFDDILFPRIGTLGFAKRIDFNEEVSIFVGLGLLKPKKDVVHPKYLEYWMNSPLINKLSHEKATGSGRLTLALEESRRLPIPIAPMHEQLQIVAEIEKQFSRLDEAVANLKRVKANLKRYKAAVLKAAVEGRLVETEAERARREGRSYETGEQLLQRILETRRSQWQGKGKYKEPAAPDSTDLPELPEGWVWATLNSIADIKGGITVDRKRQDPTARAVPYLRVANVQRGYLDLSEIKTINAPARDIEALRLQRGDILFNEGGDRDKLGRGWIWEDQLADCIHQNHVFRARLTMTDINPKLISWWGNTFGKDYFLREGKQTTNLASINLTKLSAFPVPIPPTSEQQRIVAEVDRRLSLLRETETQVDANLRRAERLRQSVLGHAFSENNFASRKI